MVSLIRVSRFVMRANECSWLASARRPYSFTSVLLADQNKPAASTAISKLNRVFEKYQKENYKMELPSRFRKEIVKATDKNKDGMISVDEIEALLKQIGASEQLTHEEIEQIMSEAGLTKGVNAIPIAQFLKIF